MSTPGSPQPPDSPAPQPADEVTGVRSLRDLIDQAMGRGPGEDFGHSGDSGLAETIPFPFLALVGQREMKLALLLALINPNVGGVLLIGPRGTGKTTAVRSLVDLLPEIERSACYYGCLPEDIEAGGMDAVCPDCARKYGMGEPLTSTGRVQLVELPLNATLEDVIGGLDERARLHDRLRLKRGILAQADRNLLYADEVNLLADPIIDALLDAAAQGVYTVRRGPVSAVYRSRFTLIGSMNPEEGRLRPQILDRFGLRVLVTGLTEVQDRLEAYQRVQSFLKSPRTLAARYAQATEEAREDVTRARRLLPNVAVPAAVGEQAVRLVQAMKVISLRAEIALLEAARAYAAADQREQVEPADLAAVAPLALRLRRSEFMDSYLSQQQQEAEDISAHIRGLQ